MQYVKINKIYHQSQLDSCVGVVLSRGSTVLAGDQECIVPQSTKWDAVAIVSEVCDR